jgi:hypothetical protein
MGEIIILEKKLSLVEPNSKKALKLKKKIEKILNSWGYNWTYARAIKEIKNINPIKEIKIIPTVNN